MIDWTPFDKYPKSTCTCRCGVRFRSHGKAVFENNSVALVSRDPCPACGKTDDLTGISSDPEELVLDGTGRKETR
jgi:hypothetical protein